MRYSYVHATSVDSQNVPLINAGMNRRNLPKTLRRFSSGGRGRRFESSLPDHIFQPLREKRYSFCCCIRCSYSLGRCDVAASTPALSKRAKGAPDA